MTNFPYNDSEIELITKDDNRLQEELQYLMNILSKKKLDSYNETLQKIKYIIKTSTSSITAIPKPLKYMSKYYQQFQMIYENLKNFNDRILCADILSVLAMTVPKTATAKKSTKNTNNYIKINDCIKYRLLATVPDFTNISSENINDMTPMIDICEWGHDYIRYLSSEIAIIWYQYKNSSKSEATNSNVKVMKCNVVCSKMKQKYWSDYECLRKLVHQIIPFTLKHNAESEACDLAMEIDELLILEQYIDENSYDKVSLYMYSCVLYVIDPENMKILRFLLKLAQKYQRHIEALRFAMILSDNEEIQKIYQNCPDDQMVVRNQMALLIGKQRIKIEQLTESKTPELMSSSYKSNPATTTTTLTSINTNTESDNDRLNEILANGHINTFFLNLARDLDILEPKSPDDIYKNYLNVGTTMAGISPFGRGGNLNINLLGNTVDSAKHNLAASFVNGFINTGFGVDKMFLDYGSGWVYKNKNHGMISATASLGLIKLWDIDGGLAAIDKYLYSMDEYVKAGALLACGIVNCGVRSDVEPAQAILSDYLNKNQPDIFRLTAILGLGIAYSGTNNHTVLETLRIFLVNLENNLELLGITGLAIGMISVGQYDSEDISFLFEQLLTIDTSDTYKQITCTYIRFLVLGLGLLHLGCQEKSEALLETADLLNEPLRGYVKVVIEICSYAGSGNVLQIQKCLHICSENVQKTNTPPTADSNSSSSSETNTEPVEKTKDTKRMVQSMELINKQSAAVIGVALITLGEDLSIDMCLRSYTNLMRYGELSIRRMVPLALGLSSVSNPQNNIIEMLQKYSHDYDPIVAMSAIFALGLIGAGTNNARVALILRQLCNYYTKEGHILFIIRVAQGFAHMAKGTVTLSPHHNDRQILRRPSLAALLAVIFAMMDSKNLIAGSAHYLLYLIVPAIEPRWLITVDTNMQQISVPVRIGIPVDVVAQAGKPKTITGFQTNSTPVLLATGERAELATDEYISVSPVLEGVIILQKRPEITAAYK